MHASRVRACARVPAACVRVRTEVVESMVELLTILAHLVLAGVVLHEQPITPVGAGSNPATLDNHVGARPGFPPRAVKVVDAFQLRTNRAACDEKTVRWSH
jgi:hypothetical protein